uniref:Uncharacterized protein n=1 Tax=Anas zonorhyncha TaxID=75864 RepID=A0A8B9U324_9AVES
MYLIKIQAQITCRKEKQLQCTVESQYKCDPITNLCNLSATATLSIPSDQKGICGLKPAQAHCKREHLPLSKKKCAVQTPSLILGVLCLSSPTEDKSCYYFSDDWMPWDKSQQNCSGMGSQLGWAYQSLQSVRHCNAEYPQQPKRNMWVKASSGSLLSSELFLLFSFLCYKVPFHCNSCGQSLHTFFPELCNCPCPALLSLCPL